MSDSDIFNKYAELAMKRGLISKGEDADSAKSKLMKNPRMSPQDASAIELLYGVKPDAPKSMTYEKNIVEVAHPNAVVVAPAHDKLNGLVENLNERNNILINIVNKQNNGQLMSMKYASDELVRSLVRVANDMDNKNSDQLRILADTCLEQINKEAISWQDVKNFFGQTGKDVVETGEGVAAGAAVGGIIGGVIGLFGGGAAAVPGAILGAKIGGLAGGIIASIAKTSPEAKNVSINAKDTLDQLQDLINKSSNDKFLNAFAAKLRNLIDLANKYAELSNNPNGKIANTDEAKSITENYIAAMEQVKADADIFLTKADSGEFSDKSPASKVKQIVYFFIDDDVDDVRDSIASLKETINNAEKGMNKLKADAHSAIQQTTQAPAPTQQTQQPQQTAQTSQPAAQPTQDELNELQEMLKKYPDIQKLFQKS